MNWYKKAMDTSEQIENSYKRACLLGKFTVEKVESLRVPPKPTLFQIAYQAYDGPHFIQAWKNEFLAKNVCEKMNTIHSVEGVEEYLTEITKKFPGDKMTDRIEYSYEMACLSGNFRVSKIESWSTPPKATLFDIVYRAYDGDHVVEAWKNEFLAKNVCEKMNTIHSVEGVEEYLTEITKKFPGDSVLSGLRNMEDNFPGMSKEDKNKTPMSFDNPKHVALLVLIQRSGFGNEYNHDLSDNFMKLHNRQTGADLWVEWGEGEKIKKAHLVSKGKSPIALFSKNVNDLALEVNKLSKQNSSENVLK